MSEIDDILGPLGIRPIYDRYFSLPDSALNELEEVLAASLPGDFREFLSKYGVSTFDGLPAFETPGISLPIDCFFGDASPRRCYDIRRNYSTYLDDRQTPAYLLPFAMDMFGNLFCISTGVDRHGSVVAWEAESGRLLVCSPSFTDFLRGIRIEPYPDEQTPGAGTSPNSM